MSQTFVVLPTAAGEARDSNAKALGLPRRYTHMAVGDGGGALPCRAEQQPGAEALRLHRDHQHGGDRLRLMDAGGEGLLQLILQG